MKMLVHRVSTTTALPFTLEAVKGHIRVTHDVEDTAITAMAKTAAAEIEQFAQIALLTQTIHVTIYDPNAEAGLALPIGPAADADGLTVTIDGEAFTAFEFVAGNRPYIRWLSPFHELKPSQVKIEYLAGFGAAAADIPPDLAQALLDQAALHYDARAPMDAKSLTTSPHMARIGARYRGVTL